MRIFKASLTVALTVLVILMMNKAAGAQRTPTEVQGILPEITTIYDSVVLRGHIVEQDRRGLFPAGPCVVTACYAQIGQHVEAGQVLLELEASVSEADTRAAVYSDLETAVSGIIESSLSGEGGVQKQDRDLAAAVAAAAVLPSEVGEAATYQIVSPISGIVMEIASEGVTLSGILPCAVVSDMNQLAVSAQVGEDTVGAISEGMKCTVAVDALGITGLSGQVGLIMPYARQTGLIAQAQQTKTQVIITLPGGSQSLRPGYSATAKIAVNVAPGSLTLPYAAIGQDEQNREYVMVLQNGTAEKRYIQIGREMERCAEIISGVRADELVLLSPGELQQGQRVVLR